MRGRGCLIVEAGHRAGRAARVLAGLALLAAPVPAVAQGTAAPQTNPAPQAAPPATPAPQPPAAAPAQQAPLQPKAVETVPIRPAGINAQEVTLAPVPVLTFSGTSSWEEAYDKLTGSLKQLNAELKRLGLSQAGDVFVVYTSSDDAGFEYEIQVPFSGTTTQKPAGGMKLAGSHAGKALKFTHTGSFADMDNTYEQIANYLDEKNIDQTELYIEQYRTDPLTTSPEALQIDILVPVPGN